MQIVTLIDEMREYSRKARADGETVGLVPTMGCLHEGHLSLFRAARKECDIVVVSIFVNPIQFGPSEDLKKYPRNIERDKFLAGKEGVDVTFVPSVEHMYPGGEVRYIEPAGELAGKLCGVSRPWHFRGVTTVVAKLFDIVRPDKSYFGQKDAQQSVVIKRMVRDLEMPIEIKTMPIIREKDGLAMSSRNAYLSGAERQQAKKVFGSLKRANEMAASGEYSAGRIKEEMRRILREGKDVRIEYIDIVDTEDLRAVDTIEGNALIAVAVFVGKTRLIDNVIIRKKS